MFIRKSANSELSRELHFPKGYTFEIAFLKLSFIMET